MLASDIFFLVVLSLQICYECVCVCAWKQQQQVAPKKTTAEKWAGLKQQVSTFCREHMFYAMARITSAPLTANQEATNLIENTVKREMRLAQLIDS